MSRLGKPGLVPDYGSFAAQVAGTPYRPSNGTEGDMFFARFCDHCEHDRKYRETDDGWYGCPILAASFAYDVKHPDYPKEWVHDADAVPICTAYMPEREPGAPHADDKPDSDLEALGQLNAFDGAA